MSGQNMGSGVSAQRPVVEADRSGTDGNEIVLMTIFML